jgi:hypothetical protein
MLLAPKRGSDLRGQVAEQARQFGTRASEQYRKASETASGWADRGRDIVNQAREAVTRRVEETRGYGTTTGSGYHPGSSTFGDRPASGTDYGRS